MKKIYRDTKTNYDYSFNHDKLIVAYDAYIKQHKITKKNLNKYLAEQVKVGEEAVRKHISKKNTPSSIEQIYDYGVFLERNRYAFLSLRENEESFYEKTQDVLSQKDFVERCIQAVRAGIISILAEYAASDCFNNKEGIKDSNILIYYRKKVDDVETMIYQIYKNHSLVKGLLEITTSLKRFVCSSEVPGVPIEWYEINPNLKYYTASFSFLMDNHEEYEIVRKKYKLDYYPSIEELNECREYFENLKVENSNYNYHYNDDDFYQRELINTIDLLFREKIEKLVDTVEQKI